MHDSGAESVQFSLGDMNCYEWRKKITGSVSVTVNYSETGDGYTVQGGGTITHGELYTGWTNRELQCEGAPLTEQANWVLRGSNLCEGRAVLVGSLTPLNTIPVTFTPDEGDPVVEEWSLFWQIAPANYEVRGGLIPVSPYPDWEDDPYSVASRNAINSYPVGTMLVGIAPTPPSSGFPNPNAVPIRWLKDGEAGQSESGFLSASIAVTFTLT